MTPIKPIYWRVRAHEAALRNDRRNFWKETALMFGTATLIIVSIITVAVMFSMPKRIQPDFFTVLLFVMQYVGAPLLAIGSIITFFAWISNRH